jgi:acetylornithine deacetylase/succinyl-diaminopimelate desuccinylase-like protein
MAAAAAIQASGAPLRGDLIFAGVVGEISRAPIDQYQGHWYRSKGIGTRYLLTHGIVCDYAIVADASSLGVSWAQCGVVYAKITLPGRSFYTPFTRRAADPRASDNAIVKTTLVVDALERWAVEYERANVYRFANVEVLPKVSIGAIAAGAPFKVANTPLTCSLYVDVRLPPGKRPIEVERELRRVLDAVGVAYELELFLSQMGYEGQEVEPILAAIHRAHERIIGRPVPPPDPGHTSGWNDTNLFNEIGIPAVKFGLGPALRPAGDGAAPERIPNSTSVEDLLSGTKIYVAASLDICGVAAE